MQYFLAYVNWKVTIFFPSVRKTFILKDKIEILIFFGTCNSVRKIKSLIYFNAFMKLFFKLISFNNLRNQRINKPMYVRFFLRAQGPQEKGCDPCTPVKLAIC